MAGTTVLCTQYPARVANVVAMKCRGQAAITIDDLPRDKAMLLRKHLMKRYGGASADVRRRGKDFRCRNA